MKKKILLISAAALAFVLLLAILIPKKDPHPVATKIEAYLDQYDEDERVSVNLADFTDFAWDKVVVYYDPADADEAENLTEKEYLQVAEILSSDTSSGMIFFQNGEVVHAEVYPYECDKFLEERTEFKIYASSFGQQEPHCRAFMPNEAKFEGSYYLHIDHASFTPSYWLCSIA